MKLKMRKLLIFSFLLCTFFSTLLALTPNIKAVENGTLVSLEGATITWKDEAFYTTLYSYKIFDISFDAVDYNSTPPRFYSYDSFTFGTNGRFTIYVPDVSGASFYRYDYSDYTYGYPSSVPKTWIISGGDDVDDPDLCSFIQQHCTVEGGVWEEPTPINPSVTVNQDSSSSVNITSSSDIYYMINNSNYWVPFITSESSFPYTIDDVSSIQFKNDNLQYDLIIYNWQSKLLTLSPGSSSRVFEVTEPLDLSLALVSSTDPLYHIEGYYTFNSVLDIPIDNLSQFEFFSVGSGTPYEYMTYNNSTGVLSYIEVTESGNTYTVSAFSKIENGTKLYLIDSQYQYIFIESSSVDEYTYNYLISNGKFGEYNPPPETDSSFVSDFLLGSLDNFLSFELYPGFSLLNLLSLIVAIPLLIYILKLFLGG